QRTHRRSPCSGVQPGRQDVGLRECRQDNQALGRGQGEIRDFSRGLTTMLRFWHPVMLSRDLPRDKATGVEVAGRSLALFRSGPERVGALGVVCPHRRMRLSLGTVHGGRLTCPYHGWTFDCDGNGESPSTPKLYACAEHYDCRDEHGVIWVK